MKIQIASDLHLEWVRHRFPEARPLTPAPDADLLVLAGDIHSHDGALAAFRDWPVPVVYVAGNHEAYGTNLNGLLDHLRQEAQDHNIHFLELRGLELQGVRILGATMWTDYELMGTAHAAMAHAQRNLMDHRAIGSGNGLFTPEKALERHRNSLTWLRAHLAQPFEGKTVVVTHHGPHPDGVAPQYKGDPLNGAFFSDLRHLMGDVDLWVHGHTHSTVDLQEGRCRVLANPRGYPLNLKMAASEQDLVYENKGFLPQLVVEI